MLLRTNGQDRQHLNSPLLARPVTRFEFYRPPCRTCEIHCIGGQVASFYTILHRVAHWAPRTWKKLPSVSHSIRNDHSGPTDTPGFATLVRISIAYLADSAVRRTKLPCSDEFHCKATPRFCSRLRVERKQNASFARRNNRYLLVPGAFVWGLRDSWPMGPKLELPGAQNWRQDEPVCIERHRFE